MVCNSINPKAATAAMAPSLAMADQLLPYDLLLEIFSYLPVKKILQLQLLSRPFRRFAADRRFRLLQSQRNRTAAGVFIADSFNRILDFILPNHAPDFPLWLVESVDGVLHTFLFATSRGLLFYRYGANFLVVNPACHEMRGIPAPPVECCQLMNDGFAVKFLDDDDHLNCKYQLVYLRTTRESSSLHRLCLYDSAAGEWIVGDLQVGSESHFLRLNNLVVFEGSVFGVCSSPYMTSAPPYVVAAIDPATRLVDFFPAPDSIAPEDKIILAVWEEAGERPWLCLVRYNKRSHKFTLWRWSMGPMWVKFYDVSIDHWRCEKMVYDVNLCNSGTANGMVLFFNGVDQLYAYSFKRQQLTQFETKNKKRCYLGRRFMAYINSLQPCY